MGAGTYMNCYDGSVGGRDAQRERSTGKAQRERRMVGRDLAAQCQMDGNSL